ncbi:MAG: hypothetical protein ACW986_16275 [Promethearchaeota archaeon]|jgi:glucose-6-phosphate isomerase
MIENLKLEYYPKISEKTIQNSVQRIQESRDKWESPFFFDTSSYANIDQIEKDSKLVFGSHINNVIILGTGGSIQTLLALKHLSNKRIFPITSSRSLELRKCLEKTTPLDSVVIVISRGGETLDVNSTVTTFLKKGYKLVGLSSAGTLNKILKKFGSTILEIPDLSGRYAGSVTNVGIVPAYISGIKIKEFLKGLTLGYTEFSKYNNNNRALEFAAYLYNLYIKKYKSIFAMPYSRNLEGAVGLWVQAISESSGKNGKGMLGTTQEAPLCQHSVLEYLLGGTKGVVAPVLWTIDHEISDMNLESFVEYVNGKSAHTIINYQADATFQALIQQGVPTTKVSIKNPTEINMGVLIAFMLSSVYYFCLLIGVNWASNPKVIIGKEICNKALQDNLKSEEREEVRKRIANEIFEGFF